MSENTNSALHRRGFLQAGATAAAALSMAPVSQAAPEEAASKVLPRRRLGKTGVDVTILNQGTWRSPDSLDRLLRMGYANGIRYIDTAKSYGSEPGVAKFFEAMPAGTRKEYFLVTKDSPRSPRELATMLDQRLAALKTDYIDLFFIHALGDHHSLDDAIGIVKGQELKEAMEAIKKSGKARFIGFSTHHQTRPQIMEAAAEAGIVDAIMVAYVPWLDKDAPLNRALDACHKRGIGLISMKQVAGNGEGILREVPKHVPSLAEKGLSPYQGLLHAIWTDERISSCCVSMRNTDQLRENTHAARVFEPLKQAEMEQLHKAILAAGPSFCANCDGSCSRAAGTDARLGELARLYTYHEQYGFRGEARELYAALPDKDRDWKGADLDAARHACPNRLDFASLLPEVDRKLA
ncbi:MAG: aldo/keto reductase [Isosphaeraceae bacterium]|nr:aldo/keto reductase [Isosphaeraceae bacterium]